MPWISQCPRFYNALDLTDAPDPSVPWTSQMHQALQCPRPHRWRSPSTRPQQSRSQKHCAWLPLLALLFYLTLSSTLLLFSGLGPPGGRRANTVHEGNSCLSALSLWLQVRGQASLPLSLSLKWGEAFQPQPCPRTMWYDVGIFPNPGEPYRAQPPAYSFILTGPPTPPSSAAQKPQGHRQLASSPPAPARDFPGLCL